MPNYDYDLKYWRIYYNAMLHVNIKKWRHVKGRPCKFVLEVCVSVNLTLCQVNTAQSNTLVHSIVTNRWAKFGAKIFTHFSDIAIFVLGYFILPHPVFCLIYHNLKPVFSCH